MPPEEWGPEYPIPGAIRPTVPIPTLYADGKYLYAEYWNSLFTAWAFVENFLDV